jgi:hypothetical protein
MPARPGPHKYDPLTRYLAALTEDEVTLPFAAIELILGATLPRSARQSSFWTTALRPMVLSLSQAGWRVRRTDLRSGPPAVTFVRVP